VIRPGQLSAARHISGRRYGHAIELCVADVAQHGARSCLRSTLMLCHWWRGERECAYRQALDLVQDTDAATARPALEVAASYAAIDNDAALATHSHVTRLAHASQPSTVSLVLQNPGWFARSIDPDKGRSIVVRVRSALDSFVADRVAHDNWAQRWLDADADDRGALPPPPV